MRRPYIDWLRGVAVLIMIEWHAIDAWTADDVRASTLYQGLGFLGGWAAPLFLFLAGVAVPMAAASHVRKGRTVRDAGWQLQKRGWQVFALAHAFRLQSYLLNPGATWHSLLKPDILNILGLGMVAAGFCWGRGKSTRDRIFWLLGAAALTLVLAPLSRGWWWPTLLHPRFEAYVRPTGGWGTFTLFPWIGFVFAGAAIGEWLAQSRPPAEERALHHRLAAVAVATIAAGAVGSFLPSPFERSSFWTTSVSFFLIRLGVMTLALAASWWWMNRPSGSRWSPMLVFGRTSLFVYWVHVELAYGFLTQPLRHALPLAWSVTAYLMFVVLLLWWAVLWLRRPPGTPWVPAHLIAERS